MAVGWGPAAQAGDYLVNQQDAAELDLGAQRRRRVQAWALSPLASPLLLFPTLGGSAPGPHAVLLSGAQPLLSLAWRSRRSGPSLFLWTRTCRRKGRVLSSLSLEQCLVNAS